MLHSKKCLYVTCQHCGHEVEINLEEYGLRPEPNMEDFREEMRERHS